MIEVSVEDLNFEEDAVQLARGSREDGMKRLSDLVRQQILAEDEIEQPIEKQEEKSRELTRLRADLIPSLMHELGFAKVTADDGSSVEIKPVVQASLPKDEERKSRALKWLRDSGCGDVIKNEVSCAFGRGEDELAEKAIEQLGAMGVDVMRKISVHPQTLSALVRSMREEGRPVDSENLTLYEGEVAKITRPKSKKRAKF